MTLQDRKSSLLTQHIGKLKQAMKMVKQTMPYSIVAIVVLPDHLHAIWKLPEDDVNYSARWRRIKTVFTQSILNSGVNLSKDQRGEYRLWQRRFWEHTISNEYDMENHVNYIHYNPVKHGLVNQACDWPYSSFHRYVAQGFLSRDWGGVKIEGKGLFGE